MATIPVDQRVIERVNPVSSVKEQLPALVMLTTVVYVLSLVVSCSTRRGVKTLIFFHSLLLPFLHLLSGLNWWKPLTVIFIFFSHYLIIGFGHKYVVLCIQFYIHVSFLVILTGYSWSKPSSVTWVLFATCSKVNLKLVLLKYMPKIFCAGTCRPYEDTWNLSHSEREMLRNVHRRVFLVLLRLSTNKESSVSYCTFYLLLHTSPVLLFRNTFCL